MAFTASTVWEVESGADDVNNAGGFDAGVAGFPTDGAATSATGASPVFTSASYNFVAGDVNAWIYIKSGTNWTPGWYKIASVASNAATLNATIGQAVLAAGTPTTVVGCATTASPTAATWGIDYSQNTSAQITFTDMIIDATTNTKFTSVLNPVGKNFVGNIISVTSGTGFSVQRVAVVSTSGTTATCDKSLGTLGSVLGNGRLGGAFATLGAAVAVLVNSNQLHIKSGAYTIDGTSANTAHNIISGTTSANLIMGYGTVRGDMGTAPVMTASGIATTVLFTWANNVDPIIANITLDGASLTSIRGFALGRATGYKLTAKNMKNSGFFNNSGTPQLILCQATGCSTQAAFSSVTCYGCVANANTITGFSLATNTLSHCLAYGNTGAAVDGISVSASSRVENSVAYGNGRHGISCTSNSNALINNIAEGNGVTASGFGFNIATLSGILMLNNAGFNNNASDVSTASMMLNLGFLTLTASPFTSASGGDFSLNNTASAGAACRGAGILGVFPAGLTTGHDDVGAAQHADPASGVPLSRVFAGF